jgi:hypothetical protein
MAAAEIASLSNGQHKPKQAASIDAAVKTLTEVAARLSGFLDRCGKFRTRVLQPAFIGDQRGSSRGSLPIAAHRTSATTLPAGASASNTARRICASL